MSYVLRSSPLLKKAFVRQAVLDKRFPLVSDCSRQKATVLTRVRAQKHASQRS